MQVCNSTQSLCATTMPEDVLKMIIRETLPKRDNLAKRIAFPGETLRSLAQCSKRFRKLALEEKRDWIGREGISLNLLGCRTGVEAVGYVIRNQLRGANLEEFPNLDDLSVAMLIASRPNLSLLYIKSWKITQVSVDRIGSLTQLKELRLHNLSFRIEQLDLSRCEDLVLAECQQGSLLGKITLPNRANSLERVIIERCERLKELKLPEQANALQIVNIFECHALTRITFPEQANSLIQIWFQHCNALTQLQLPDQVDRLQKVSFDHRTGLTLIKLPKKAGLRRTKL